MKAKLEEEGFSPKEVNQHLEVAELVRQLTALK